MYLRSSFENNFEKRKQISENSLTVMYAIHSISYNVTYDSYTVTPECHSLRERSVVMEGNDSKSQFSLSIGNTTNVT